MAKAQKAFKTVTKTVEVEEADGITLHLSEEEARVVTVILRRVGGGTEPRVHSNAVMWALQPLVTDSGLTLDAQYNLTGSLGFN